MWHWCETAGIVLRNIETYNTLRLSGFTFGTNLLYKNT